MNAHPLDNEIIHELSWTGVTVSISQRRSRHPSRTIVHNVCGHVQAGEMLAILGPSGCGKTTLLNVLAHRSTTSRTETSSKVLLDGHTATESQIRSLARFVESDDILVGALTVRETLYFAARLGLGIKATEAERNNLIEEMLSAFGLLEQASTIVGTLVTRGISTGQKRRLSIAAQLITAPKVLFLDEPTSGLDSAASFKVMSYLKRITKAHGILVVCSIHQPSSTTFGLFDKTLVLSGGRSCYFGGVNELPGYLCKIGRPVPVHCNTAEFVLDLINVDFEMDPDLAKTAVAEVHKSWEVVEMDQLARVSGSSIPTSDRPAGPRTHPSSAWKAAVVIMHRSWIKSRRDVMVYGARLAMYLGLALLMGTVWVRLPTSQDSIEPIAHCILFGSTFMSFMAVVYVPAFIEDYQVFVKDRSNGLYGSTAFVVSNFVLGLPYLFILALVPSILVYWLVNFRPDGSAFMVWVLWTYLNLLAAESLVVLVSAILSNFIGALAAFAMLNAVFMACNGFMVPPAQLNAFYHYVFYYINYHGYVYRGLARNEYASRQYDCGTECQCRYPSSSCDVSGLAVLQQFGFEGDRQGFLVGVMVAIIVAIRLLAWAALKWK